MGYKIGVIRGDGIGPEIVDSALKVLETIGKKYGHNFIFEEAMAGGVAYDKYGHPLPEKTIEICRNSHAILLGSVGGDKWDNLPGDKRPERAILGLRKELGLFANLRPGIFSQSLEEACPLKSQIVGQGFDILLVRELTGGIYFGERGRRETEDGPAAYDVEMYSQMEVERIARLAFDRAQKRRGILTSVDKSNVLETSRLWRRTVDKVSGDYPKVKLNHMYVDNAAMQLIRDPGQFDVVLTNNLFGDILSDEISMLTGSIGILPSASLGQGSLGLYEPIHGSAPDIAGRGLANPIGTILSAAMMLRLSFNLDQEARAIEFAVNRALEEGYRTKDIVGEKDQVSSTMQMTEIIVAKI